MYIFQDVFEDELKAGDNKKIKAVVETRVETTRSRAVTPCKACLLTCGNVHEDLKLAVFCQKVKDNGLIFNTLLTFFARPAIRIRDQLATRKYLMIFVIELVSNMHRLGPSKTLARTSPMATEANSG